MSVFSRNDKAPDPVSSAKPPETKPPERGDITMSTSYSDPKSVPVPPVSGLAPAMGAARPAAQGSASIISKALKITGQLESTEDIEILGEVNGDVRAVTVKVGPNAKVKGTV